jgi:NAD(P)-dependent dehydrogenase (short-subunit alcohol dehydrogenase family)
MGVDTEPNKVYMLIGGTSGMGLSAARALVGAGHRVALLGRSPAKLDAALDELGSGGVGFAGDATDSGASESLLERALETWGRLDGLYHVAGGSGRSRGDGPVHELTDEGIEYTLDINLKSLLYSNRTAVRQFKAQGGGGVILNMGSVLGYSPAAEHFCTHVYTATKAAVIGFTQSVAAKYAPENIRANVIAPALVETPMAQRATGDDIIMDFVTRKQPLDGGRISQPDDLDKTVLYLLTDASKLVTGQVLAVDGGWSVS